MTEASTDTVALVTRTVRLSKRYTVTLTFGRGHLLCEWSPHQPNQLSSKELRIYRRARNEMLAEMAAKLGNNIVLVEM